jgi:hypothetical protein
MNQIHPESKIKMMVTFLVCGDMNEGNKEAELEINNRQMKMKLK